MISQREYIWQGNPEYWGKHSPILFPIVGTLKNNSYQYKGVTYELSRHGFARDIEFTLICEEDDKVIFSLQFSETTLTFYPFKFELQITYTLLNAELNIKYTIINNDSCTMPFSIGGHPAFALTEPFENYCLLFENDENLISYQLQDDLLSNKTKEIALYDNKLPLSYSLFENDALIFKTLLSKQIQLLENGQVILNFKLHDFPNFGIWTKVNAPFICLEPWAGYSDTHDSNGEIMTKEATQLLESNCKKSFSFSIEIS
jgi:galactose mutarotase-like enzyme